MVSRATLAGHVREPLTAAWTSTRTVVTVTQALALAAAISASPRIMGQSGIEGPSAFQIEVAKHIDSVAHFEKDRFYLTSGEPKTEIAFDLYDEAVRCERAAAFNLVFLKNDQGSIAVGICDKEEPRVRDLAQEAQRKLAEKLGTLARSSPQPE